MSTTAVRPALRTGEFVFLIALLMSLVALATDAMLPALPAIGHDLGAPRRNDVQFVITALFPVYFGALALAIGAASLVNGRLVMKHGMRRLSRVAAASITLVSAVAWALVLAFEGLPPLWLFMAYLTVVFVGIGLLFGNLNALAMEPLGHIAGVGAAVVASLSTFISVPFGALVGQWFDGTMYALIAAFAVFGAGTFAATRWAEADGGARRGRSPVA